MKRLLSLLILCLLAPVAVQAEGVPYHAPPQGLVLVLDAVADGTPMVLTSRVVSTKGDEVLVETEVFGMTERSTYFRWLVSKEASGNRYEFDEAAVAALWPLEKGKHIEIPVTSSGANGSYDFLLEATVEDRESLTLPAGTFDAVVIFHTLTLQGGTPDLEVKTRTWLDTERGIALKTETTMTLQGQSQSFSFAARELQLP